MTNDTPPELRRRLHAAGYGPFESMHEIRRRPRLSRGERALRLGAWACAWFAAGCAFMTVVGGLAKWKF